MCVEIFTDGIGFIDKYFYSLDATFDSLNTWWGLTFAGIFIFALIIDIACYLGKKHFSHTLEAPQYREWLITTLKKIYPGWEPTGDINNGDKNQYACSILELSEDFNWASDAKLEDDNYLRTDPNYPSSWLSKCLRTWGYHNWRNKFKLAKCKSIFSYNASGGKALRYRISYYLLLRDTIRFPYLLGYTLNSFYSGKTRSNVSALSNKINGVDCNLATYLQNVMTSHIMEYELYRLYIRNRKKISRNEYNPSPKDILDQLPYRKTIHMAVYKAVNGEDCKLTENLISEKMTTAVFTRGDGRHSLLSVQAMLIYPIIEKDGATDIRKYRPFVGRRSDKVAIYKNHLQIVPAGGFEMYERSRNGYNIRSIKNSFNPKLALDREILEELLNEKSFDGKCETPGKDNVNNIVENHEFIQIIGDSLDYSKMHGITIDVVYLRHVFSYIMVLKDSNKFREYLQSHKLILNDEFSATLGGDISIINNFFEKEDCVSLPDSAGLAKIFVKSDIYEALKLMEKDISLDLKTALKRIEEDKKSKTI